MQWEDPQIPAIAGDMQEERLLKMPFPDRRSACGDWGRLLTLFLILSECST